MRPVSAPPCTTCAAPKSAKIRTRVSRPQSLAPKREIAHAYVSGGTTKSDGRGDGGSNSKSYGTTGEFEKQPLGVTRVHEKRTHKPRTSQTDSDTFSTTADTFSITTAPAGDIIASPTVPSKHKPSSHARKSSSDTHRSTVNTHRPTGTAQHTETKLYQDKGHSATHSLSRHSGRLNHSTRTSVSGGSGDVGIVSSTRDFPETLKTTRRGNTTTTTGTIQMSGLRTTHASGVSEWGHTNLTKLARRSGGGGGDDSRRAHARGHESKEGCGCGNKKGEWCEGIGGCDKCKRDRRDERDYDDRRCGCGKRGKCDCGRREEGCDEKKSCDTHKCGDTCREIGQCCERPVGCGCGCRRHRGDRRDDDSKWDNDDDDGRGRGDRGCGDMCRDTRKCCDRPIGCGCGCRRHEKPCGDSCGRGNPCGDEKGRGCGADKCGDTCRDARRCCERPIGCDCGCRRHKTRCGGGGCNDCKQCGQIKKPCRRRRVPPCAGTLVPLRPGDIPEARYRVVVDPDDVKRENPLLFAAEEIGDGVAAGAIDIDRLAGIGGVTGLEVGAGVGVGVGGNGEAIVDEDGEGGGGGGGRGVVDLAREEGVPCVPPSTAEIDLQKKRCDLTYADVLEPELVRRFLEGETVVVGERAMVNWRVNPTGLFSQNIAIPRALLFEILGRDPAGGFVFRARPPDIFLNPTALRRIRLLDVHLRALDGLLPLPFATSRESIIYQFCFTRHIKWWVRIRRTPYNTLFPGNKRRLLRFETYNEVIGLMAIMRRAFHCTFVAKPVGLCFFPSEFCRNPLRCWAPITEAIPDSVATYDYIRRIRSNPREQLAVLPPAFLGPIYAYPTLEQRRAAIDLVIDRARRIAACLWRIGIQVDFEAPWSVVIDCRADVWIVGIRRLDFAYRLLPLDQYLAVVDAYVDAGPLLDIAGQRDREDNVITNPDPFNFSAVREAAALEDASFIETDEANPGIAEFDFNDNLVRGSSAPTFNGVSGDTSLLRGSGNGLSSGNVSQGPTPQARLQALQNIGRPSSRSRR
jgi:hypothetical protein